MYIMQTLVILLYSIMNFVVFLQSHPFIKKFEDNDVDLGVLFGSLDPPAGLTR